MGGMFNSYVSANRFSFDCGCSVGKELQYFEYPVDCISMENRRCHAMAN